MLGPQNAQDFIRALKASSDPPHADGPLKVEIARQAWDNAFLYVPNKAEAIVDWLLSRLLKDRSRDRSENPVVDTRYWELLADILAHSNPARGGDHSRTLRSWLVPLLNRIPIAPIVLSYFELLSTSHNIDLVQYKLFAQCVSILWPLAVPKFSPETLLECFGAVGHLSVSPLISTSDGSWGTLHALDDFCALSIMVSSYRTSLANSAAKRKQLNTLFLKKHLPHWLHLVSPGDNETSLLSDVYDAGIETMYGLEIVKQTVDGKHDSALSDALENTLKNSPAVVLRSLPRLFASYVQSVKRHKGALFGQSSNQTPGHVADQLQAAAMAFYATCQTLARTRDDEAAWQCRVSLLQVIQNENLFSPKDEEAKALLRQDGDLAVEALATAWHEENAARTNCAVKSLAALVQIDYDLTSASFAVVYPRLLAIPGSISAPLQYLRLLLEYDSKTRNLPSAVVHVSDAFSVQHLARLPHSPHAAYQLASASPLTSLPFLDWLARAVSIFLTPGQVLETIADISRILKDAYERFLARDARHTADCGDGPRKKRRKDAPPSEDRLDSGYHAVSFALIARTMVVVLRSLPLHSLTDHARTEAEGSVRELCATVAVRALVDGFGCADRLGSRPWQLVLTGALRLYYGLVRAPALHLDLPLEDKLLSAILEGVSSEGVMPELIVEMLRTLLHQCSLASLAPEVALDKLLDYLEAHLSSEMAAWTGKSHALDAHSTGGVAVLHLLVDRWLPEFDAWATSKQLGRLASILVNARRQSHYPNGPVGLSVQTILSRMLHDAQFWELLRLRDKFIAQITERTDPLVAIDLSDLLSHLAANTPRPTTDIVSRIASAYDILLLTPPEYLPRAIHIEFLKRGFVADVVVHLTLRYAKKSQLSERNLLAIREVLRRTMAHLGVVESVVSKEFLNYLLVQSMASEAETGVSEDIRSATIDLVDMYQGSLVRLAKKGDADSVIDLARRYARCYGASPPGVGLRPSLLFIDTMVQSVSLSDLSAACIDSLHHLHKGMLKFSLPQLSLERKMPLDYMLLDIWAHVGALGRWLGLDRADIPTIGRRLSSRLLSPAGDKQVVAAMGPAVLSILLGELQDSVSAESRERVEYMAVAYLALARVGGRDGMTDLESRLASACRTLSSESFSSLLDLVYDGLLLQKGVSPQDIASLIRLSSILLVDAPEGTSKICQAHTTKCLILLADDERFITTPALRGEVLNFLVHQCSDRPASIRTADLSSLWSILRALLSGSSIHDQSTDATVFHGVVNVLSALVRLRRDLVLNTLPHLGFALRQLTACLRGLRPQLGGKQSRLVMDTLPRWIASTGPLSAPEGKALARLLTTLNAKTIVRVHGAAADVQKPESLMRPFSKHAAYVLTAYVDAVNDPLCFVPLGIRKELQPGLFALCEMLGEHNRDAMMVAALDAGGKATMKVLWKEYEKQRYVGKG